jgi:hypothetical protein
MKMGKCPGCLKTKQLLSSHLISSAIYNYLRTDDLHPIVAGGGRVRATTDQIQDELLCQECELMLSRGGESWIVGKLCTAEQTFPLYDLIYQQAPIDTDADGAVFAAGTNPAIAVQKISHFALGIFWKASLHPWKFGEISLGPYGESIRTWLRGEATFPQNLALNVILSKPSGAQIITNPPYLTTEQPCHTFLFHVPGVLFRLSVGNRIPVAEKALCFCSSAQHFIVVSDTITRKVRDANAKTFNESTKTKSYEKARAKQKKLTGKP